MLLQRGGQERGAEFAAQRGQIANRVRSELSALWIALPYQRHNQLLEERSFVLSRSAPLTQVPRVNTARKQACRGYHDCNLAS